jgi:hypothetical protein
MAESSVALLMAKLCDKAHNCHNIAMVSIGPAHNEPAQPLPPMLLRSIPYNYMPNARGSRARRPSSSITQFVYLYILEFRLLFIAI